jgi:hypothetical protein
MIRLALETSESRLKIQLEYMKTLQSQHYRKAREAHIVAIEKAIELKIWIETETED